MMINDLRLHTNDDVRAWIRGLCEDLHISPTHLGRKAGVAHTTINRFMKAEWSGGLNLRTIEKIERAASRIKLEQAGVATPATLRADAIAACPTSIPAASLEQRAIDVRRRDPHTISISQGDSIVQIVTVLDIFVDELVAALLRVRGEREARR